MYQICFFSLSESNISLSKGSTDKIIKLDKQHFIHTSQRYKNRLEYGYRL